MDEMNRVEELDFQELKNIPIEEIENYFPKKAYDELVNMGFNNVGDLLESDINGELIKLFYARHKDAHELWNVIHGTITLLKYKYLEIDLSIDFTDKDDYSKKMGFTKSIQKRLRCYYSNRLSLDNIIIMIENNDYSPLYRNFTQDKVFEIVSKFQIVKDYLEQNKKETTVDDLKVLYEKLASLVKEHSFIEEQIKNIQEEIQNKIKGGSHK